MTVHEMVTLPKTITRKKRAAYKTENRHQRMNIDLDCGESVLKMRMFIRILCDFPEDFSVGLILDGPNEYADWDIILLRFQGPHGGQSATRTMNDLHNDYHIHEFTDDDMAAHRKRASYKIKGSFNNLEMAISMFLEYCNISDPNGFFNEEREKVNQIRMNFNDLGEE